MHSLKSDLTCAMLSVRRALLLVLALTLPALSSSSGFARSPLRLMTYNVRYASNRQPNSWAERRPVAKAMLDKYRPDVIGMQEALYRQVKDFSADLSDYHWIGLGREGGSRGEFMAVFFRARRLEPVEFDHYWLSDTPDVIGSSTWGNSNRRMVTWVLFRDLESNHQFYVVNTHFDHRVRVAREKSAKLLLERSSKLGQYPVVVLGDFNAAAQESEVYRILVGPDKFQDTWTTAEQRGMEFGTFHGFRGQPERGRRIDWILSRGAVTTKHTEIVTFHQSGQYPSDHFPVIAVIELETPDNPR